jgi:hypothetical protein
LPSPPYNVETGHSASTLMGDLARIRYANTDRSCQMPDTARTRAGKVLRIRAHLRRRASSGSGGFTDCVRTRLHSNAPGRSPLSFPGPQCVSRRPPKTACDGSTGRGGLAEGQKQRMERGQQTARRPDRRIHEWMELCLLNSVSLSRFFVVVDGGRAGYDGMTAAASWMMGAEASACNLFGTQLRSTVVHWWRER